MYAGNTHSTERFNGTKRVDALQQQDRLPTNRCNKSLLLLSSWLNGRTDVSYGVIPFMNTEGGCHFFSIQWTCDTIILAKQWLLYVPLCTVSVPQGRQVVDRLSRRKTGFNTRSAHVRFCGGRSNCGTASSPSISALPPNIILPTLHSHSPNHQQCCSPPANDSSIQQHNNSLHFITTVY